jgi:hypothetical protein
MFLIFPISAFIQPFNLERRLQPASMPTTQLISGRILRLHGEAA